jgi:hypothetical protein
VTPPLIDWNLDWVGIAGTTRQKERLYVTDRTDERKPQRTLRERKDISKRGKFFPKRTKQQSDNVWGLLLQKGAKFISVAIGCMWPLVRSPSPSTIRLAGQSRQMS